MHWQNNERGKTQGELRVRRRSRSIQALVSFTEFSTKDASQCQLPWELGIQRSSPTSPGSIQLGLDLALGWKVPHPLPIPHASKSHKQTLTAAQDCST